MFLHASTVMAALFHAWMLMLILRICLKYNGSVRWIRPDFLTFVVILLFARLLVPCCFLLGIPLPAGKLLSICDFILLDFKIGGWNGYDVLGLIWAAGILVAYLRYRHQFHKALRQTDHILENNRLISLKDYLPDYDGPMYPVYISPSLESPCSFGVSRQIMIPDKPYTRRQMEFILRHELNHLNNHDMVYIHLWRLIAIIYWWNPFIKRFESVINFFLEVRCDYYVVNQRDPLYVMEYCQTLVQIARPSILNMLAPEAQAFVIASDKQLNYRIRCYTDNKPVRFTRPIWYKIACFQFLSSFFVWLANGIYF